MKPSDRAVEQNHEAHGRKRSKVGMDQTLHQHELTCNSGGFGRAATSAESLKFSYTFYKRNYVLLKEGKCEKQCVCDCVLICSHVERE